MLVVFLFWCSTIGWVGFVSTQLKDTGCKLLGFPPAVAPHLDVLAVGCAGYAFFLLHCLHQCLRCSCCPHRRRALQLPRYETKASAGMDLRAAVGLDAPVDIPPLGRVAVPTGLTMAIPEGFEAQIRPRSGLAFKHGLSIPNSPGTIDSDYRGEIKVLLINLGQETFRVERGMRIAQMIIAPVLQAQLHRVSSLSQTDRGAGGFGSTGV